MAVLVAIPQTEQSGRLNGQPRLLDDLALDGGRRHVAHVGPAARRTPEAVRRLADKKDLPVPDDDRPHVDLGCRVTRLRREGRKKERVAAHQFGRDLPERLVALAVVAVLGEGEPGLCEGLDALGESDDGLSSHRTDRGTP